MPDAVDSFTCELSYKLCGTISLICARNLVFPFYFTVLTVRLRVA